MDNLLSSVQSPSDLKKMDIPQMEKLSEEIRAFLIENVPKTGGHFASNLGVVELTVALHRIFSAPEDKIIWDVGHQSYVHKILTGRRGQFSTLRQFGGLSGFPKKAESEYDAFDTGHSSTSISAALGFAAARDLKGEKGEAIAVIGDAAFSGGLSMEALNHIAHENHKVIVFLNDNQMSIGKVVGGFSQYLNKIRTRAAYYTVKRETNELLHRIPVLGKPSAMALKRISRILRYWVTPGVVFEKLGCRYLGPVDGHNIRQLCDTLSEAKRLDTSVLVHVLTRKGKGYAPSEEEPSRYHAVSPKKTETESCSARFGKTLLSLAEEDASVVAISPSMPEGTGLSEFMKNYPDRFFDTGIAEAHAATFSAGLAEGGMTPVLAVYSSFLQRAYDSLVHDVALGNRHVILAVDRAGIVGSDGETHQGIFDISYLSHIPNMSVLAPADMTSLTEMLQYAVKTHKGPIAVRYPRGALCTFNAPPFSFGKAAVLREGQDITIAALGRMAKYALSAAEMLSEKGIRAEVIDLRSVKPLDVSTLLSSAKKTGRILTVEDNTASGGVGEKIAAALSGVYPVHIKAFPDTFVPQGTEKELFALYKLDAESLSLEAERILKG